jgi:hypothetical protein
MSSPSIWTADLDMLNCIGTVTLAQKGKNTSVWISFFYLTAILEYFEYMRMPLQLFPIWIQEQYDVMMLV